MSDTGLREARRALARLRRSIEKASRELRAAEAALRSAEGESFSTEPYGKAAAALDAVVAMMEAESERLDAMVLETGVVSGAVRHRRSSEPG